MDVTRDNHYTLILWPCILLQYAKSIITKQSLSLIQEQSSTELRHEIATDISSG